MLGSAVRRMLLWSHKRRFRGCGRFFVRAPSSIRGHDCIELGNSFVAGTGLRLHAIKRYQDETFSPLITIGDNFFANDYVHIGCINRISIGNNVLLGSKIYISDHNHGYYDAASAERHEPPEVPPYLRKLSRGYETTIGDNVWIGEFVSVLPGARIGRGSVVAANSVVKGVVPEYSIVAGAPARVVKRFDFERRRWIRHRPVEGEER